MKIIIVIVKSMYNGKKVEEKVFRRGIWIERGNIVEYGRW